MRCPALFHMSWLQSRQHQETLTYEIRGSALERSCHSSSGMGAVWRVPADPSLCAIDSILAYGVGILATNLVQRSGTLGGRIQCHVTHPVADVPHWSRPAGLDCVTGARQ